MDGHGASGVDEAVAHLTAGRTREALEGFDALAAAGAKDPRVAHGRAVALARLGRTGEALAVLRAALASGEAHADSAELLRELEGVAPAPDAPGPAPAWALYGPALLTTSTLARAAMSSATWDEILAFHGELATDPYTASVDAFYRECRRRYGADWQYLDIVNVLYTAVRLVRPRRYLEVGVRRGRSACVVARAWPAVDVTACDMWIRNYAGMENPGPDFVRAELARAGHRGRLAIHDGDSHVVLPKLFAAEPDGVYDLITIDGDHSEEGALQDLRDVIGHLAVGGVLVFDDITHPQHPYLRDVWRRALAAAPGLAGFEWAEHGYGVAFAIRRAAP